MRLDHLLSKEYKYPSSAHQLHVRKDVRFHKEARSRKGEAATSKGLVDGGSSRKIASVDDTTKRHQLASADFPSAVKPLKGTYCLVPHFSLKGRPLQSGKAKRLPAAI